MPWCHSCRGEYRVGIERCPECDEVLHANPPEAPPSLDDDALLESDRDLAVIAHADLDNAAEMRRQLREALIPSIMLRQEPDPNDPYSHHNPRFDVAVEEERLEEAIGVLQVKWRELLDVEQGRAVEPEALDTSACPACGHAIDEAQTECPDCGLVVE